MLSTILEEGFKANTTENELKPKQTEWNDKTLLANRKDIIIRAFFRINQTINESLISGSLAGENIDLMDTWVNWRELTKYINRNEAEKLKSRDDSSTFLPVI